MHTVNIVVGDWSHDGHSMTETYTIESNLTGDEIEAAYKKGTEKLGFDLVEDCCAEYEDNQVSLEQIKMLEASGFDISKFDKDKNGNYCGIWHDLFVELYLHVIKLGDDSFKWDWTESEDINIGGYGLFQ
jgi:hypothetical protein